MRILFMGTGAFAVPILHALHTRLSAALAVITRPDKPAGRKKELKPPLVKGAAEELGLPVYQPEKLRDPEVIEEIKKFAPDVIVVAEYGKLIPKEILEIPKHGAINAHPSLLPKYRGPSPVQTVILNGEKTTGVSIMLLDEEMDHGPILAQASESVRLNDDGLSLLIRLAKIGAELLTETLPDWIAGKFHPQEQDHSAATYTKLLTREDGRIDWSRPAEEVLRKVRALFPWPGTWTIWGDKRLAITNAEVVESEDIPPAGTANKCPPPREGGLCIACGRDYLRILLLRPEGKREMSAEEFLRGSKSIIGSKLV